MRYVVHSHDLGVLTIKVTQGQVMDGHRLVDFHFTIALPEHLSPRWVLERLGALVVMEAGE